MTIFAILTAVGAFVSAFLFRRGGIYNPINADLPVISVEPADTPIPVLETPVVPVLSPTEGSKATLENFCLALRDFEGLELNPATGKPDQNWRLNNPGNCRYNPGGYMPMYGKVGKSKNGFAIFQDYETGWKYLRNMIKVQIHNSPNKTIYEFMLSYAPPADSNPTLNYATFIGKRLGVNSKTFKVKNLV